MTSLTPLSAASTLLVDIIHYDHAAVSQVFWQVSPVLILVLREGS